MSEDTNIAAAGTENQSEDLINKGIYRTALVASKTAAGAGLGVCAAIGAVVAAGLTCEIVVPAILLMKACGFAGGALGFCSGLKK
ncbi:MAG: hypothetical protein WCP10_02180 [Desulfuromonadales bacterium]